MTTPDATSSHHCPTRRRPSSGNRIASVSFVRTKTRTRTGIMERVHRDHKQISQTRAYGAYVKAISARGFYLSYDAVYKLSSSRRKVRMVFHRSEKSSTKHHLRCVPLIPHVRIRVGRRYRKNTSMRLVIHLEDHCYQHILRRDDEDPLLTYELSTVGLTPAPYLVTKCMLQPAEDEHRNFPIAASIVTMGPIHRRSVNWRRYIQEGTNA